MLKNYHSGSIKVDTIYKGGNKKIDILPTCYKVKLSAMGSVVANGFISAECYKDNANLQVVRAGTALPNTVLTYEANTFFVNPANVYTVAADGVALSASTITITTATAVPASLIGAPIRILFNEAAATADPLETQLPSPLYINSISGTTVTISLDKVTAWAATSTAAIGIEVLSPNIKKNLPAIISSVTVSGDTATLKGTFPAVNKMEGSQIAIPSNSLCVSTAYKGKGETLTFVVQSYNIATGNVTVLNDDKKLKAMAAGSGIVNVEINKIDGFGNEDATETAIFNTGSQQISLSDSSIPANAEILVEQFIAG